MIKIITGSIHSYKTTKAFNHYQKNKQGDGFLSIKHMDHDKVLFYESLKLSTSEKKILAYHNQYQKKSLNDTFMFGPYHFKKETFHWIMEQTIIWIKEGIHPIYLDEVGQLELQGHGYHDPLKLLIQSKVDLILVIRSDLIDQVTNYFGILSYEIL